MDKRYKWIIIYRSRCRIGRKWWSWTHYLIIYLIKLLILKTLFIKEF